MRALHAGFVVLSLVTSCGGKNHGDDAGDSGGDAGGGGGDACVGLECQVVDCSKQGRAPTTLTGTVFAPNGTLPLYGVNVYVPREMPGPFTEGAQCSRCGDQLSGSPLVRVQTDEAGRFQLEDVPAGDNIPLVITTGKWRRQITIPKVDACTELRLTAADTRLPKNKAEGDLPRIALTTGAADALECLVRKLGIDDSEVTTDAGTGRVHLFHGNGPLTQLSNGGGTLPNATTLWSSEAKLKQYDVVFLSCEGEQNPGTKPQAAMNALKAYADLGGRVFASHWHNIWIGGNFLGGGQPRPAVWSNIATWRSDDANGDPGNPIRIDEAANPKGSAFATWMVNVKGTGPAAETTVPPSTTRGQFSIDGATGRVSALTLDPARVEPWVYSGQQPMTPQMFQFMTPNESPSSEHCGKVVFSDMHVSGIPSGGDYPNSCQATTLTPQEKALAFIFFDIASCIGPIFF
jgi:hypothetical protein